ncbi:PREDICTED: polyadenylate-binding protein 2-like [Camelina sativa]|uniref:Polyadenylate-binding protein 2-like n=1 Tax=Camelina sativa TaxID=90675 RepID=A0ABM0UN23_CAMSA|nr:PREDICTED: polyadenylate-binding protein 2-like [Camelina sativa]
MAKQLKKCSTSTDVEDTTKPWQNELDDSEVILKEQKKEIDEDVKTAFKKKKKVEEYDCNFDNHKEAFGNNHNTIVVKGFDCSLSRDDIKSSLEKHFGSCGEISRVFVPFQCQTGSPLGYAFIDLRNDAKKALTLDGSYLGSLKLEVVMTSSRKEFLQYPNLRGCARCCINMKTRNYDEFLRTGGGRLTPWTPELQQAVAELLKRKPLRRKKCGKPELIIISVVSSTSC